MQSVMYRFILVFVFLSHLVTISVRGQDAIRLQTGKRIERNIAAGEKHSYLLELDANQFVFSEVVQMGVDVVISVFSPEKKLLSEINWEFKGWEERFTFESTDAGLYGLEISPSEIDSGHYIIEVKQIQSIGETPEERADQLLTAYYKSHHLGVDLGMVAAVYREGYVAFAKAYGMANLTHRSPFTTETSSNICHVSEQFTGFAIALLEKEGKLSLDDDVRKYIPELPGFGRPITLLNLINHTSGLRVFWHTFFMQGVVAEDTWTRQEIIQLVRQQRELLHTPGEKFSYSSTNYILLAEVIEHITDVPFSKWMEANVFDPLGMEQTTIKTIRGQVIPNSAQGYGGESDIYHGKTRRLTAEEGGVREFDDLDAYYGASSIYSTVGDLAKWLQNFQSAGVGGMEVISRITERGVLVNGDTTNYGFGLFIDTHRGLQRYFRRWCYDGGHRASLTYYPEIDAGLIFLGNDMIFRGAEDNITEIFFEKHLAPEVKVLEKREEEEAVYEKEAAPGWFPSEEALIAYTGVYFSSELGTSYTITIMEGRLAIKHHRLGIINLKPIKPDVFAGLWPMEEFNFERGDDEYVNGFYVQNVHFEKLK
jgi:CubicO group peptidase (beta-lactamase class C family)